MRRFRDFRHQPSPERVSLAGCKSQISPRPVGHCAQDRLIEVIGFEEFAIVMVANFVAALLVTQQHSDAGGIVGAGTATQWAVEGAVAYFNAQAGVSVAVQAQHVQRQALAVGRQSLVLVKAFSGPGGAGFKRTLAGAAAEAQWQALLPGEAIEFGLPCIGHQPFGNRARQLGVLMLQVLNTRIMAGFP